MGEVSLSRALAVVDEIAGAVGGDWQTGANNIRSLFADKRAYDSVEVVSRNKEFDINYKVGVGKNQKIGAVRFYSFGDASDLLPGSKEKSLFSGNLSIGAVAVFATALGAPLQHSNPLVQSAQTYCQCLMQATTSDDCEKQRSEFQPKAEQKRIADLTNEAKAIWNKVDTFLEAARKADEDDSDLENLEKIVARYSAARPIIKPVDVDSAIAILVKSKEMLAKLESSDALRSLVFDEGARKVKYIINKSPCRYTNVVEYSLGSYSFGRSEDESGGFGCREPGEYIK